ncbi:MAG: alpha/beta hydrolase family protein, partial [Flavobacteriales bacterium]
FSIELNDLSLVLDWSVQNLNMSDITLLGHSRGGGVSILKSGEDTRVKRVISWSSPSNFLNRISMEKIEIWEQKGVSFVYNGRTKQNMPLYIQLYNDCEQNKDRLDIQNSVSNLTIPQLVIHGDSDPSVDVKEAYDLHKWNSSSELFILKDADHVFGASHPCNSITLPSDLQIVVDKTIGFIQ